jgi:flagellar protein FlaG
MADQVNLTGSLAPVVSPAYSAAKPSQPLPENPQVAKPASLEAPKNTGQGEVASPEAIRSAAQTFSAFLQLNQPDLVFQVDKATGEPYFKIVDTKTRKVIRQVPSEDVLAMARKLHEVANSMSASGVLVDKVG